MSSIEVQKKIRLMTGAAALIVNATAEYLELMSAVSFDTKPDKAKQGQYDFVQVFGTDRSILTQLVKENSVSGKYDCLFWICYPKGGGKIKSNLNRNVVWEITKSAGMRCVSQVASISIMNCRGCKYFVAFRN
jgi:hypothetical protein